MSNILPYYILLFVISISIIARPPNPDEIEQLKEQQLNNSKEDYDTLPDIDHIPENFKEDLKKQKMRYLKLLQQNNL